MEWRPQGDPNPLAPVSSSSGVLEACSRVLRRPRAQCETKRLKTWLKRGLSCLTITLGLSVIALWLLSKACEHLCPDTEAKRLESPDKQYVVSHTIGDNCGGATVA